MFTLVTGCLVHPNATCFNNNSNIRDVARVLDVLSFITVLAVGIIGSRWGFTLTTQYAIVGGTLAALVLWAIPSIVNWRDTKVRSGYLVN